MSRRSSNVDRNRWTVELLDLATDARVLELGYGPGIGIEAALRAAPRGQVVGLDHSHTMRTMAARRSADAAADPDRLRLLVGDAENLPPNLGTFDAIFSCNVWLFWTEPVATITALAGLLNQRGRLAITHLPRHGGASRADTEAAARTIEDQMRQAGLDDVRSHVLDLAPAPATCVIARKPAVGGE